MTIWFTSDTHWGHANIIKYSNRPFSSREEMDEMLIKNWNDLVQPSDVIYHMGDFSFHQAEKTLSILKRLNGQKHMVKGNHDKHAILKPCYDSFVWVKDYAETVIDKQLIVMCHFPFLTWNKSHHGSWNLHGHCHGSLPEDPHSRRLDVGVDCHDYRPISFEQVRAIMAKKIFRPVDHHGNV